MKNTTPTTEQSKRLEELRAELRNEQISYSELAELQTLTPYIDKNDVELLEASGVPEQQTKSNSNILTTYNLIQHATNLQQTIKNTPNDSDLGAKVRRLEDEFKESLTVNK